MDLKPNMPPATHESAEHEIRRAKIKKMQDEGIAPWPSYKHVTATTHEAINQFNQAPSEAPVSIAGRLLIKRDHGKTFFGIIQDRTGKIQIYIKKDDIGELAFEHFKKFIDIGDILWINGPLFLTKMGEITVKVESWTLMSKCLFPLPEKFHGLTDVEHRYRQRYLDLISNPETREKFKKRSHIIQSIRAFLVEHDFLEVETPMLHPIPGGAAARPFITHHNAYDMQLYLRIAPELYLKRLVVGGLDRVFEINRNFRNEGISTRHNPEFTMLEFYMAYGDYHTGISMTEQLISRAIHDNFKSTKLLFQGKTIDFTPPFKQLSIEEALLTIGKLTSENISLAHIDAFMAKHNIQVHSNAARGTKLFALFEHFVEPHIVDPTFITHYPIEVSPLAKRDENDPTIAARFELFVCGMECANGFTELNDPFDQAERFKAQADAREGGDQEAHYYDADYIKALEYGLPPTVGVGIGIDRLVMLLTDTTSIKDVILFPTLKATRSTSHQTNLAKNTNPAEKPSIFIAHPELLSNFNNPRIAISIIKNADNTGSCSELHEEMANIINSISQKYTSETLTHDPMIAVWREAYKMFGSKPSEFPSSIESLYKRILRTPKFNPINPLVDIYNYISLKYMLPAGGENLDAMRGPVELTYASAHEEPVMVLGKDKPEAPYEGEVIYKDSVGTICRRWNWREVKRTILTPKTNHAIIVLEALGPVSDQHLRDAQHELTQLIEKYCKAEVMNGIIDKHNNTFNF